MGEDIRNWQILESCFARRWRNSS